MKHWVTALRVDGLRGPLGQTLAPMGLAALCAICVRVGRSRIPGNPRNPCFGGPCLSARLAPQLPLDERAADRLQRPLRLRRLGDEVVDAGVGGGFVPDRKST